MTDGIYILANDLVYDQLVALLNSIEANAGQDYPICILPYNDRLERVREEVKNRSNVEIYDNQDSIQKWDKFFQDVWDVHPNAREKWTEIGVTGYHRFGTHRRFCAFDGCFDRFLYMDADTLLQSPVEFIFKRLDEKDFVVYDFQYTDFGHVYNESSTKLFELFTPEQIRYKIFCSGFYASKKSLFAQDKLDYLLSKLRQEEAEILYNMSADQPILNYMVLRGDINSSNLALELPKNEITGCCVTSNHFKEQNHILYDKHQRLTYIHYIGLSSKLFSRICLGENIDFPYRDIFLYYRYLHEPQLRPQFTSKPKAYNAPPSFTTRVLRKLGITIKV